MQTLWCCGLSQSANVVVDHRPVCSEAKGSVEAAFQWAAREGGLCEEPVRGVRFNLLDAVLHASAVQRGTGQAIGALRRCLLAAELSAEPALQEPVFRTEVMCPDEESAETVREVLDKREAVLLSEATVGCRGQVRLLVELPASQVLGLDDALSAAVGTCCTQQSAFSHWSCLAGPVDTPGRHLDLVLGLRRWRQLGPIVPTLMDLLEGPAAMASPADVFAEEL